MAVHFPKKERKVILPACAICSNDCYFFDRKAGFHSFVKEIKQHRMIESPGTKNKVQYALYRIIVPGPYKNKRILAFRGTFTVRTILQDLDLIDPEQILSHYMPDLFGEFDSYDGWNKIRDIIDIALYATNLLEPDYVTGHSLGGLMAEVVSSYTKTPGFAFNCPGPVGFGSETTFLNPDKSYYQGVKFEVHLRKLDPVAQINDNLHIHANPVWYSGYNHCMKPMIYDIRGIRRNRCCGCGSVLGCFGSKDKVLK